MINWIKWRVGRCKRGMLRQIRRLGIKVWECRNCGRVVSESKTTMIMGFGAGGFEGHVCDACVAHIKLWDAQHWS
jgi:uncharacterized protein (UPF0548 family)